MRWLYHVTTVADLERGAPPESLAREGFVHASYRDAVHESARLYFPKDAKLVVQRIDPRRLGVPLVEASTPRGPMPHLHGAVPPDAVREVLTVEAFAPFARPPEAGGEAPVSHPGGPPDRVTGTRVAFVGFRGMTLLDLVGVLDPVSRIASMGFDASFVCDVVSAEGDVAWTLGGAAFSTPAVRPALASYDAVVVAGGPPSRVLADREDIVAWLRAFPENRLMASVCTGALFLGAAGRLRDRRATTHATAFAELARYGAFVVHERVVDEGTVVTAGGVTSGIDLGLHLVARFEGDEAARAVARQMEWRYDARSRISESPPAAPPA